MGLVRKRRRKEDDVSDGAVTSQVHNVVTSVSHIQRGWLSAKQQEEQQSKRRRIVAAPLSFSFAPETVLPLWQRIVLSSLRRLHESEANERRAAARGRALQRELTRHNEDLHRREERLRMQQREMRARLGNKVFVAVERQWSRRGDVFQQLMCVEFDEVKRRHTERRQGDLLREAENLTRTLLDSIFSNPKGRHANADNGTNGGAQSSVPGEATTNVSVSGGDGLTAVFALQEDDVSCDMGGSSLENSLSLLDTQGGRRPLRDYQRSALRWMTNLYSNKLNGILADEMGLGKTIQTIALLAFFAEYKNDWGPHLIVVPTTVVLNWKAEFQRWCPGLRVLVYIGNRKERHRLRQGWMREDAFHVCITSYNLVVMDRAVFRRRPWGFLVLDEAHQVKNFLSKKWQSLFDLQAEYRLLLTGTPLQNSIMELWSLFHFLLPSASAFKSNDEFREWFSNPMEEMVTGRTTLNEDTVRRLQALLRPFMLRRLKKDVESQLPSKMEKVVMCRLSSRQRLLYDDYMQLTETREKIRGGAGGVLGVLLALRKVCDHPDMFEERRTISPMTLDNLSEIALEVPREILLLGNDFGGCYRFQKWSLFVDDVSFPPCTHTGSRRQHHQEKEQEQGEFFLRDSWLDCNMLRVLRMDQPCEQHRLDRYSPKNFSWPTDVPLERVVGAGGGQELSGALWSMLSGCVKHQQSCIANRRRRTIAIQAQRYCEVEACIHVWYPRCLHIFPPGKGQYSLIPPALHPTVAQRARAIFPIAQKVAVYVPRVLATHPPRLHCRLPVAHYKPFCSHSRRSLAPLLALSPAPNNRHTMRAVFDASSFLIELWPLHVRRCFDFPDKRLIIHDCGKLQFLEYSLKHLRREGHRMLIFTQFVQMLNILERFLAIIGLPYLRIDGATQVEKRQAYVDRFNEDERITCMILSTRSGGIGLNLTGADTVIFYDSDWNPTMDLQAQDRCHRIGQTKPVTIYRLISEHTVEESILQKARERKKLNNIVIRGGQFHAMAGVEEIYEDSSAALAALSDPVHLRSFFHDLDEDATVVTHQRPSNSLKEENNFKSGLDKADEAVGSVDIRAEMMMVEDQEDREAQENMEEELRVLEQQKRNDEVELGDEEGDDVDEDDNDVEMGQQQWRENEEAQEKWTNNDMGSAGDVSYGGSLAGVQKRREIMRRQRTPLDRLLSLRFGFCHVAEARKRYNALCESYSAQVGEDELPPYTAVFQL